MTAQIGGLNLLVYLECPCGESCAIPEGGRLPLCTSCGGYYVPGGGPTEGPPMYGRTNTEARQLRCLGYVGFLTMEEGAVRLLGRLRDFLGTGGMLLDRVPPVAQQGRHYTKEETTARSDEVRAQIMRAAEAPL